MKEKTSIEPSPDSIIQDLHRIREAIADSFGGDLHRLTEDARKRQEEAGHKIWHPFAQQGAKKP